jgi:hypothetical protein
MFYYYTLISNWSGSFANSQIECGTNGIGMYGAGMNIKCYIKARVDRVLAQGCIHEGGTVPLTWMVSTADADLRR